MNELFAFAATNVMFWFFVSHREAETLLYQTADGHDRESW